MFEDSNYKEYSNSKGVIAEFSLYNWQKSTISPFVLIRISAKSKELFMCIIAI